MTLTIEMNLDNADFSEDDFVDQIEYCLRNVTLKISNGEYSGRVVDTFGNTMGTFEIE